jgi:glycine/D-amino acid oxidase-like deaminating enzyme
MSTLSSDNQSSSNIPSYWNHSAISYQTPSTLEDSINVDVTIIGAGFTGLRAALELAKANISVAVLDSEEPGWGASGRTGGQVNPLAHAVPEKIISQLGDTFGPRMLQSYVNSGNELFSLIKEHGIQCDAVQNGWLRAAHCKTAIKQLEEMQQGWSEYGLDINFVEGDALHKLSGSKAYDMATQVSSGGCIQPLSFCRELSRVAIEKGAQIFAHSGVQSIKPQGAKWQVKTAKGQVTSQWVLFCTNGYTDNTLKGLKQSVIPLVSVQAVTRPLTDQEYASVLPNGHTLSDTRRVIYYARKDNHDRLLFGSLGMSDQCNGTDKARLQKALQTVFPQFTAADLSLYWGGKLGFTADVLPHLHEPAPGVLAGLGYNGRGVAMASVMGRILAERVSGKSAEELAIPTTRLSSFPFHSMHKVGTYSAIKCYEMRDALDVKFF